MKNMRKAAYRVIKQYKPKGYKQTGKRNILYSHEEYNWNIKYKEYKGSTIDQLKNKYVENPF